MDIHNIINDFINMSSPIEKKTNNSGGSAMAGGIDFQAAVSTIVSIAVARGTKLHWLPNNDIPIEWSAETGGSGDDIQVRFKDGAITEFQVKKGLSAGPRLWEPLLSMAQAIHNKELNYGLLIICSNSSRTIREHLANDIVRLGDGRTDDLKKHAKTLQSKLEKLTLPVEQVCNKIRIITVHALDYDSADIKTAIAELEHLCEDKDQREIAWDTLYLDALFLVRNRGRRTPSSIMKELDSKAIKLKGNTENPVALIKKITKHTLDAQKIFSIFGIDTTFELDNSWISQKAIIQTDESKNQEEISAVVEQYHSWDRKDSSETKYPSETIGHYIKHCVVVAGPGMGKSTLLKKLARVYSKQGSPVLLIRLPQLVARIKSGSSFTEGIFELGLDGAGISYSELQNSGIKEFTILLDGLDECGTYQEKLCESLISFVSGYSNSRIIITTRPIGYSSTLLKENWQHYELLPLDEDHAISHIDGLIKDIYEEDSKEFETVHTFAVTQLKNEKASKVISRNPFLLGLAVSLFLRKTGLGNTKTDLYENLFKLIDEKKSDRVNSNEISQAILIAFLNIIAWDLLRNPIDNLDNILERCATKIGKELDKPKLQAKQIAEDCLKYWEQLGLLEQLHFEGTKTITFIHKTFSEYAAARYLVSLPESEQIIQISSQVNNDASHETLDFAISLGAENIVFQEIVNRLQSQDDKKELLIRSINLLSTCEEKPNNKVVNMLLDFAFEHIQMITRRFDLDVAESLLGICDKFSKEIFSRSTKLLDHSQGWTKLSAWAFIAKTDKDKEYEFNKLIDIFREASEIDKNQKISSKGFQLYGLGLGAGSKLTETLVVFAVKEIFLNQPKKQADSIVKEVLTGCSPQTTSFQRALFDVLTKHGRSKLAKIFKIDINRYLSITETPTEYKDIEQIANEKIFSCLDFIDCEEVLDQPMNEPLMHLSAFIGVTSYKKLHKHSDWDYSFDIDCVIEVFKGMLGVTEIKPKLFAMDIQTALTEINKGSFSLYGRTINIDIKPEWEKAKKLELNVKKVEIALHHHSDWVVEIAANLLENILNKEEKVGLVKRLLKDGNYASLWAAAMFSQQTNRVDLVYKRLEQPLNSGCRHLFHVLQDEELSLDATLLQIIKNGLMFDDGNTAIQAAKVAKIVIKPKENKLKKILSDAYIYWQKQDQPVRHGNASTNPISPRKNILEALLKIEIPSPDIILNYCLDERDDISKISKPVYFNQLSESDELRNSFLEKVISEEIEYQFLYGAFGHPVLFTQNQFNAIGKLIIHKNSHIRSATTGILKQENLSKNQREIWREIFLKDQDLDIREKVEDQEKTF